jgi:plasmid stability protein
VSTKNITLKIEESLYDQVRLLAARHKTSLSALVRGFLQDLAKQDDRREAERVAALKAVWKLADKRDAPKAGSAGPFSREDTYAGRLR